MKFLSRIADGLRYAEYEMDCLSRALVAVCGFLTGAGERLGLGFRDLCN